MASTAIMPRAEILSKYFHATLFIVNKTGRKAVRERFGAKMRNGSAVVWYDACLEAFCLTCPASIGPQADVALGEVMSEYLGVEVRDADREGRAPNVRRFGASSVLEMESGRQPAAASVGEEEVVATSSTPLTVHRIVMQGATSVRFFQLRELPGELLRRTLVSFAEKGHSLRVSLRAIRTEVGGGYSFNGSVGVPLPQEATNNTPLYLDLVMPYTTEPVRRQQETEVNTWTHGSEKPSVLNWVRGLGDSVLEDTLTATPIPSDALKIMAKPDQQMATGGRARVVKGAVSSEYESDSSSATERMPSKAKGFKALMRGNTGGKDQSDDESDTTTGGSDAKKPATFNCLFARKGAAGLPTAAPVVASQSITEPQTDASASQKDYLMPYSSAVKNSSTKASQQPSWDAKAFSKVDKIGLTADPAAQAKWDIDNYSRPGSKALRSTAKGSTIVSMSESNLASPQSPGFDFPVAPRVDEPPVNKYKQTQFNKKSWERNVAHLRPVAEGGLIDIADDSALNIASPTAFPAPSQAQSMKKTSKSTTGASARTMSTSSWGVSDQPGTHSPSPSDTHTLQQAKTSPTSAEARSMQQRTKPAQAIQSTPKALVNPVGQLIDYSENTTPQAATSHQPRVSSENAALLVGLRSTSLNAPAPKQSTAPVQNLLDLDDPVDERLQAPISSFGDKKNTMNQQARYKPKIQNSSKNSSKSGGVPKAQLPMSDAPPPPAPKVPKQKASSTAPSQSPMPQAPQTPQLPVQRPVESTIGIVTETLQQAKREARVEAQFGIIFNREFDGKVRMKELRIRDIEAKLNEAGTSTFNTRLTISPFDANHIIELGRCFSQSIKNFDLSLASNAMHAHEVYEIHVLNELGQPDIYNLDVANNRITKPSAATTELYLHYPVRVWDARVRVLQEQDQEHSQPSLVRNFLNSVQPDPDARKAGLASFSTILQDELTVGKVLHKRSWTLSMLADLHLNVTEVRVLMPEPIEFEPGAVRYIDQDEGTMIWDQRRWWEASVHTTVEKAEILDGQQGLLQYLLDGMDGVGSHNKGPRGAKVQRVVEQSVKSQSVKTGFCESPELGKIKW